VHDPARLAPGRVAALAWWAGVVLAVAFVLRGGVGLRDQVVLHVLVGGGAVIAASLPSGVLGAVGAVRGWLAGAAALIVALAVGLVPLPASALATVAPGLAEAWPERASHTLSYDFEATIGELGTASLVLGYAFVVGVWGAVRRRRHLVERAIVVSTAALVTVGIAHRMLGLDAVFGVVETSGAREVLWGPLVNENHMATVVLLGLPVSAAQLAEHQPYRDLQWALSTYVLLAGLGLLVAIGSPGALLAGLLVTALAAAARSGLAGRAPLLIGAGGLVAVAILTAAVETSFVAESVVPRRVQWTDSLRTFADHWLAGVGGGAYGDAFPAYRTDGSFRHLSHAHSDVLEWIVETGIAGALLGLAALWAWWPRPVEADPERARPLELGVLAVAIHAFVDFPLQIPAVGMAAAAVLVCRSTVFVPRRATSAAAVRVGLGGLAVVQVAFAAWQLRTAKVEEAIGSVSGSPDVATIAAASDAVERWAPWRPEAAVLRAWRAEKAGDRDAAVAAAEEVLASHPDDADALRKAALVFARSRRLDRATIALERAAVRAPNDQRTWVALARVKKASGDVEGALAAWDRAFETSRPGQNVDVEEAFRLRPDVSFWVPRLADSHGDWSAAIGMLLIRNHRPDEALLALEQAARLEPYYRDDLRFAEAMTDAGRLQDAEAWLRERQERRPDDPAGHLALGRVLTALGDHAGATAAFEDASELRPEDPEPRVLAVRSVEAGQGAAAAILVARRYEATGRRHPRLTLEIARILRDSGDKGACIVEIETNRLRDGELAEEAGALFASCGSS
jgi:tetratricopeptide (TPR) repeat protein